MTGTGNPVRLTFNQFYRKYAEFIRREVEKRLYSQMLKNDADDMVQVVLIKLNRNFHKMPVEDPQIRQYISKTAGSVTVDFSRRSYRKNEQLIDTADGDSDSDGVIDREATAGELQIDRELGHDIAISGDGNFRRVEALLVIEKCLADVSPEQREALLMTAEGYSAAEVAEKQGVCVNTAKTRAFYGRQKARASFKRQQAFELAREIDQIPMSDVIEEAPHEGTQITFFDVLGVTPISERKRSSK